MKTIYHLTNVFADLGKFLIEGNKKLDAVIRDSYLHNHWFTEENIRLSLEAISQNFLDKNKLSQWLSKYPMEKKRRRATIGLVMAGNIPLVGFHDFLCVLISGNNVLIKLSSKDEFLLPFIASQLSAIDDEFKNKIRFVERLKDFDAVIATGSDNSARYFNYYFGKYPHIIRKNRSSVAVLTGDETEEQLSLLGKDIFQYFGLGCRNVSKIYVPKRYSFNKFFEAIEPFRKVIDHNKYKNNYDYNCTLLLMNNTPYLSNDFLMLVEKCELVSPIATLYYEYYKNEHELKRKLESQKENIQCTIYPPSFIEFGKAQETELWDYADNVDTLKFLFSI